MYRVADVGGGIFRVGERRVDAKEEHKYKKLT